MTRKELAELQQKLERYSGNPIVIGKYAFHEGEAERYAAQLEMDMDRYLDDCYDTEESVIDDISALFDDAGDSSWMFDDEENEKLHSSW
ncbi:MAG: hypothetical protein IKX71_06860 [Bacteroidales bacterium]|nr:hypothetical protein [Bacteroidales bacterium]